MSLNLPTQVTDALYSLNSLPSGKGVRAMANRASQFASTELAMLAGAAMAEESRRMVDKAIDSAISGRDLYSLPTFADEVIIGGGLHAAIYATQRVLQGFTRPVVLEASESVGGAFSVSRKPAFYLNSLNRPGMVGGNLSNRGSLNYLPGSFLQPADISLGQFQTNADIAFLVRLMLAASAHVYTEAKVEYVSISSRPEVRTEGGFYIEANRVLDARGLGVRDYPVQPDGKRILSYEQLMARADTNFPLQGMRRVAVLGGGDSGKTVMEFLLGIGPSQGYSSAAVDYIPQIDWYATNIPTRRKDYRREIRERYDAIGYYLPEKFSGQEQSRVTVYQQRGSVVEAGDAVLVNGLAYDTAVMATGNTLPSLGIFGEGYEPYRPNGAITAAMQYAGYPIFRIGPAANIEWETTEYSRRYAQNQNNKVSIFRLAPRTAALANSFNT